VDWALEIIEIHFILGFDQFDPIGNTVGWGVA
jgi:hypothetical protein